MSMSVDGLVSGMDTTSLISQLIQAEAGPQTALKTRLSASEMAASAYRTVNTTFAAVRAAAEALSTTAVTAARNATTASAGASAIAGSSLTFSVTSLASTHSVISTSEWASTAADVTTQQPAWPIDILDANGASLGTVSIAAGATLADAVKAINDADLGVKAAAVKMGDGRYRLQVTSETPGAAGVITVKSATEDAITAGSGFVQTSPGTDATIDLGGGLTATSSSNTFADLLSGVSVTVSKIDPTPVTLTVASDTDAAASKMQALVDAVNSALTTVKTYTSTATGSTAALKGEYAVTSLAGQLLNAVSSAVGLDGSPAQIGLQLTKDGKIAFDKA